MKIGIKGGLQIQTIHIVTSLHNIRHLTLAAALNNVNEPLGRRALPTIVYLTMPTTLYIEFC